MAAALFLTPCSMRPPATSMISVTSLLEQPSKTVTTPSLTTSSASTVTMSMSWRESLVLAELSLLVLLSQLLIGKIVLICFKKIILILASTMRARTQEQVVARC